MAERKLFVIALSLVACAFLLPGARAAGTPNGPSTAMEAPQAARAGDAVQKAGEKGIPMTTQSNVADAADVQAVLIPASLAKKIFGKEVAQNYAVVEVIISNKDSKASMVVQSLFLDYSQWALSGHLPTQTISTPEYQKANQPSQVASIESRLVRGELLDAQQWTLRNWTMRSLTFLGTTAVAFEFPFSHDVIQGIGAFNGTVVPGASTLWPDGTVNQINRISDFGFQTNKLVAKQSAELIVAFFPIDRFLLGTFRKEFLKRPAAWFVPYEMMADPKTQDDFADIVQPLYEAITDAKADETADAKKAARQAFLRDALKAMAAQPSAPSPSKPQQAAADTASRQEHSAGQNSDAAEKHDDAGQTFSLVTCGETSRDKICILKKLLDGVSLNNIRVVVQGVMTVDVATVPATIYSVAFDDGNDAKLWTKTGVAQAGSIAGVYLAGGVPQLVDGSGKQIEGASFEVVSDGSTDTNLNFKMTLQTCVAPGKPVHFVVARTPGGSAAAKTETKGATAKPVLSTPFEFSPQPSESCPAAAVKGAETAPDANKSKEGEMPKKTTPATSPVAAPAAPSDAAHQPRRTK